MPLAQGFAMVDAIRHAAAVLDALDAAVVLDLVRVVLMQELKDVAVALVLALDSVLDALLVQHLVLVDAKADVEELVELHPANLHVTGHVVVAPDAVLAVVHAMDATAVLADALLLAEEAVRAALLAVDAVVAMAVKDAAVTVSLRAVVHVGQLLSNFYI